MAVPVLEVKNLSRQFRRKSQPDVVAVDDVSFCVMPGECVGLVGGSGCGKSTIAQIATGLLEPSSGTVLLGGQNLSSLRGKSLRDVAGKVQMVFQNPASSFDPRRTLGEGVCEYLRNTGAPKADAHKTAVELLVRCGLLEEFADRYPHEVSGGQCQRAAIARALAPKPSLVVCDEATSALDVTVQAQIIELLRSIQRERGTSYLFICHDLALVNGFCDRIIVMEKGHVVEEGQTGQVLAHPSHPYTRQLLDAVL